MQHAATILLPLFLAAVIYPVITGALNWYLWWDTPASWDAFVAAYPKQARAIRILRAVSPHLRKVVEATRDDAARRSHPAAATIVNAFHPPAIGGRADEVALPRPTAPDAITTLRARTLTGRESFDATARQELAPDVVAAARREGERGSVDVRALLAVVVGLSVALPLGVALMGCPRLPPVSGCSPMAQTCINDSPHVCSASQRWHRAGALTCAEVGGTCAVVGGRAYCAAPVADAGAALAADGGL